MARALLITTLICASVAGAWYYRSNSFSCGRFDTRSNCVNSVFLDTEPLGIESAEVFHNSFDLSPTADQVVVGLSGTKDGLESHAAVVLFDSQTGKAIRALREYTCCGFFEIAFSKDGQLVASYGRGELANGTQDNSLLVQDLNGNIKYVVYSSEEDNLIDCVSKLEFGDDANFLQCGFSLYNLEAGTIQRFSEDEQEILNDPNLISISQQIAPFSAGTSAVSIHGITTNRNSERNNNTNRQTMKLTFPDESVRSYPRFSDFDNDYDVIRFSADGQKVLDLHIQDRRRQTVWQRLRLTPRTHAIAWTLDLEAENESNDVASTPVVMTNRAIEEAWSADAEHFALLGNDLRLSVFDASK